MNHHFTEWGKNLLALLLIVFIAVGFYLLTLREPERHLSPSAYHYDLSPFEQVPAHMLRWRPLQQVQLPPGFSFLACLGPATASGHVWLLTPESLCEFSLQSARPRSPLRQIRFPVTPVTAALRTPRGAFILACRQTIYRTHLDEAGNFASPQVITVLEKDSDVRAMVLRSGLLFVADLGRKQVWRIDLARGSTDTIRGRNQRERFIVPSDFFHLTSCPEGIAVVNPGRHRIEYYDENLHSRRAWGFAGLTLGGFSGCCNPALILWSRHGLMLTAERGMVRVKAYDIEGNLREVVATHKVFGSQTRIVHLSELPDSTVLVLARHNTGFFLHSFQRLSTNQPPTKKDTQP